LNASRRPDEEALSGGREGQLKYHAETLDVRKSRSAARLCRRINRIQPILFRTPE